MGQTAVVDPKLLRWAMLIALPLGCVRALQHLTALTDAPSSAQLTHALLMGLPFWIVWAALVPLVAWWLSRQAATAGIGVLVRHHIPAVVALSLLHTTTIAVVNSVGEVGRGPTLLPAVMMEYPWVLLPNALAYAGTVAALLVVRSTQALREHQTITASLQDELNSSRARVEGASATERVIAVRHDGAVHFLHQSDLDWVESAGDEIVLHAGATRLRTRRSLASLETELDPNQFARVHRTAIVNVERIVALRQYHRGSRAVELNDGTRIPVGRSRYASIAERLSRRT